MEVDRRALFRSLGGAAAVALMTQDQKADALEHFMEAQLEEPEYPTVADLEASYRSRRYPLTLRLFRVTQAGVALLR